MSHIFLISIFPNFTPTRMGTNEDRHDTLNILTDYTATLNTPTGQEFIPTQGRRDGEEIHDLIHFAQNLSDPAYDYTYIGRLLAYPTRDDNPRKIGNICYFLVIASKFKNIPASENEDQADIRGMSMPTFVLKVVNYITGHDNTSETFELICEVKKALDEYE